MAEPMWTSQKNGMRAMANIMSEEELRNVFEYWDDGDESHAGEDSIKYEVYEKAEWCMCEKETGLFPDVQVALSKHLEETVLGFDIYEVAGYVHVSAVEKGYPKFIFTSIDGVHLDDEGIDWEAVADQAIEKELLDVPPYLDKVESLQENPGLLFQLQFDFDIENMSADRETKPICISLPSHCKVLGNDPSGWKEIVQKDA